MSIFPPSDEILHGLAVYCFARENARIRALMADCATLAELEEIIADYLQDIVAERMGSYRMLAQALGGPPDGPLQCGGYDRLRTGAAQHDAWPAAAAARGG